ncbi:alpha/beta hydrolase [Rhizobium sp. NPDC090279]|uniref:alpha/beta hydrolase n=1 Tax=Rhizobium sp. NPDC090279 TaxID=3364499 RepID=UPI00383BA05B
MELLDPRVDAESAHISKGHPPTSGTVAKLTTKAHRRFTDTALAAIVDRGSSVIKLPRERIITVSRMRPLIFLCVLAILTACGGSRANTGLASNLASTDFSQHVLIFLATSRKPTENADQPYSAQRSLTLNMARYDVGIPLSRRVGTVSTGGTHPDPRRHFAVVSSSAIDGRARFVRQMNAALNRLPPENREIFIFVHGYNSNVSESLYRTAQIVSDFGVKSVPLSYSWPSAAALPLYVFDRDSSIFARGGLAETIQMAAETKAKDIVLVGHSMGAFVVMEALRNLAMEGKRTYFARLGGVILAAPDIDVDVFESQVHDIGVLPHPFTIVVSQRDRALSVSRFLVGGHPRLGSGRNIDLLRENGITVIDASAADGGGHGVFASSQAMMKLVENSRLARDALVENKATTSPFTIAQGIASSPIAIPLTVFLPSRLVGNGAQ